MLAINEELKQNCLTGERANSSDEEKDEEDVVGEKRGNDDIDTEPSNDIKKKHKLSHHTFHKYTLMPPRALDCDRLSRSPLNLVYRLFVCK